MKCIVLLSFLYLVSLTAYGQDTVYVYSSLEKIPPTSPQIFASYYTLSSDSDALFQGLVSFWDKKDKLYAEVNFAKDGIREGTTTYFYEERNKKSEFTYERGVVSGDYKKWYKNGQIQEDGTALPPPQAGSSSEYLLNQYWDSLGNQLLYDGNGELIQLHKNGTVRLKGMYADGRKEGEWTGYTENGTLLYVEKYREGKFLQGISYREGGSFTYSSLEEEAQPIGGIQEFYQFLYKQVKYPKKALKAGVRGTCYIRFVIDETGKVESAEGIEGRELGYGIEEEAIRAILLTKWMPGKQRGMPVKQRKILPIKFGLTR